MVIPKLPTTAILVALILAIAYDANRLTQDQRFNDGLAEGDTSSIGRPDDAYAQYAAAYELQQRQDFRKAVEAYAAVEAGPASRMHIDVKFNLANLYFRRALQLREAGSQDLAMPLIELAKQNYKEILRIEDGHWDAKHNLELALVLAPELDAIDSLAERNPERSPRALTKIQSRKALP
jgi:mxaK protein